MVDIDDYSYEVVTDYKSVKDYKTLQWTTELPKESGTYWACADNFSGGCVVEIACVIIENGKPIIQYPVYGYEYDNDFEVRDVKFWLGPLPVPESPK